MSAFAIDGDSERICIGLGISRRYSYFADGKIIRVVHRNADIGLGKAREQAVFNHLVCAGNGFFRGLANQHQRSVP